MYIYFRPDYNIILRVTKAYEKHDYSMGYSLLVVFKMITLITKKIKKMKERLEEL
jgi:hypothetical protein